MSTRQLLYLTVGGNEHYLQLLDLFLQSLEFSSDLNNIDVVVIKPTNYGQQYVNPTKIKIKLIDIVPVSLKKENKTVKILNDDVQLFYDKMIYSIQKLRIYELPELMSYEKVLYMDVDCVVSENISKLFELIEDKTCLHVCKDTDDFQRHNCLYYNAGEYKPDLLSRMAGKNILPFSGGIFGFRPSEVMAYHFKSVYGNLYKCETDFFYEQSHMNQYFNKHCISKDVFSEYILTPENESKFHGRKPYVLHYAAAHIPPDHKKNVLAAYLQELKSTKEAN